MDIKTLLANLHEEVSCSVCMVTFTEPKQLPCLHSFCLHCLAGIQRTSGRHDVITCPECRRESQVPGGNLKDLPTNFRINSLLDVLAIRDCSSTGVKCGNCDKRRVESFYCFQCCSFWCDECITVHNLLRANKDHRVLALKDFEDQDIEDVLKRPAFCPRPGHEKKELEFFCKKCEQAICNSCVATTHDRHGKILLEEAANENKLLVMSAIESRKAKLQKMRNKISKIDDECDKIETNVAKVKRSVQQFAESMIAVIEAKKQQIFTEADHEAQQSLQRLRVQRIEIENRVKNIEAVVGKSETLLKRSTNAELAQIDKTLCTIIPKEVDDEREEVDCDLEGLREFIFEENESLKTKTNHEGIGCIRTLPNKTKVDKSIAEGKGLTEAIVGIQANFALTTRNAEGQQCYEKRDRVTAEIKNHQGHDCATEVRVQDKKDGSFSPFGHFLRKLGGEGSFTFPFHCVQYDKYLIVSDAYEHCIKVFERNGNFLYKFGKKGKGYGEFDNPRCLSVNKAGHLMVCDSSNHRVQVFELSGKFLTKFGAKGKSKGEFNRPVSTAVLSDGRITVSDFGNNRIHIFE